MSVQNDPFSYFGNIVSSVYTIFFQKKVLMLLHTMTVLEENSLMI